MSRELRKALERIVIMCEGSRQPTRRLEAIVNVAMEALGFTANQRQSKIEQIRQSAAQRAVIRMQRKKESQIVDNRNPK